MGFGLPSDRQHAPDEHMRLDVLHRAIATCTHFLALASSAR
jgi:acetylornithine deacetylase/succinyl-diaminopimelate desuccinylase-like protein